MEKKIAVVWRDMAKTAREEEVHDIIKGYFDGIVPDITIIRKKSDIELIYNRYSDGVFEVVEESILIAPAMELLRHWYEHDKDAKINGEFLEYRVRKWAVKLYKYEDNFDRLQWRTGDARVILYGRVPAKIKRLVKQAVEEMRQAK